MKEPHLIQLKGGEAFFFAGLYERGNSERPDTFAILTTAANSLMEKIHQRMPVILRGVGSLAWLRSGPLTPDELSHLTVPYPAEAMEEWAVTKAVGNIRNDGPEMIEPVAAGKMIAEKPSGEQLNLL